MKEIDYKKIAQDLENNSLTELVNGEDKVFAEIWETSSNFAYPQSSQTKAKKRLMEAIEPEKPSFIIHKKVWYVAASFLLVGLLSVLFFVQDHSKTYLTKAGETIEINLSDNTQIVLQGGSELTVEKGYNKSKRDLALIGTAFFKVAKNKALPFNVVTDKGNIQVVGTQFIVQARKCANHFQVSVLEGKVVVNNSSSKVVLGKGMTAYLNNASKKLIVSTANAIEEPNSLSFVNANLQDILVDISQKYGVQFTYDKTLDATKVTFSTSANNAEDIAAILSETVGSSIKIIK